MIQVNSSDRQGMRTGVAIFIVSVTTGAASALFLWGLEAVTKAREIGPWLFFLCPVAGLVTGVAYTSLSRRSAPGNVLLVGLARQEPGHEAGAHGNILKKIPRALAPLILLTTWLAHLAGASVGREGTAVQMGGGIAGWVGRLFGLRSERGQWLLLHAGLAAGFGAVFGVPLAGAVFAAEVAGAFVSRGHSGRFASRFSRHPLAWTVAFLSSSLADLSARFWGAKHAHYPAPDYRQFLSPSVWGALLLSAIAFGLLAWGFLFLLARMRTLWARFVSRIWLRPVVGGALFSLVFFLPSLYRFAGLGTDVIAESFARPSSFSDSFMKLVFTVYSIGVGFRGGEVTPLFFIGSTFGSAVAGVWGVAPPVIASVGLVAVFAAAAGVPFACAVMAGELFGMETGLVALPVCLIASFVCRRSRLYDEV